MARDRVTPPRGPRFPGRLQLGLVNRPPRQEAASRWFVGDLVFHGRPVRPSSDGGQAQPAPPGPKTPRGSSNSGCSQLPETHATEKHSQFFSLSHASTKGRGTALQTQGWLT